MTIKKSAHALETDELLNLLDTKEVIDDKTVQYKNDVLGFISTFAIEPGEDRIKQYTLFSIYKVWSKSPIKKTDFLREMQTFLESTNLKGCAAFYINQSAIKLTHSAYKHYTNENLKLKGRSWSKQFENFLKFHNLSSGDRWIHQEILYFIYDKYAHATGLDEHTRTYMSKNVFFVYCKLYLKQKVTKHGLLYAISDNIQSFFQIDQLARMEMEYAKQEEKVPKKRRKAPRPKP